MTVTQIAAPVRNRWLVKRRATKVAAFSVSGAPAGGRVTVTCDGKGCPFAKRSRQVPPNGKVGFTGALDGHRLKPGAVIEVRITARRLDRQGRPLHGAHGQAAEGRRRSASRPARRSPRARC